MAGLAGLVMISLLVTRLAAVGADDDAVLDALGLGRRARVRLWMLEVLPAVVLGTGLGVVGAAAASGLFPVGLGGRAEPDRGVDLDGGVLVGGSIGFLLAVGALCMIVALRAARASARVAQTGGRSVAMARLASAGLSVPWTTGAGFVLGRSGRKVGPDRLAVAAVALGSMGLVSVLTFGASQSTLYAEPDLWGTTWDVAVSPEDTAADVVRDEEVLSRMQVRVETLEVDGRPIEVRGFDAVTGPLALPVAAGRPPGPDEIALGADTMRSLSVGIGDDVTLGGAGGDRRLDGGRPGHAQRGLGRPRARERRRRAGGDAASRWRPGGERRLQRRAHSLRPRRRRRRHQRDGSPTAWLGRRRRRPRRSTGSCPGTGPTSSIVSTRCGSCRGSSPRSSAPSR